MYIHVPVYVYAYMYIRSSPRYPTWSITLITLVNDMYNIANGC